MVRTSSSYCILYSTNIPLPDQPMLDTSMAWPNDYPLNSPGIDDWLHQNEWSFFENEDPLQSQTLPSAQCIAPQTLYNSSTSTFSRNNHHIIKKLDFSEPSSPETPSSLYDDDLNNLSPKQEESIYMSSPTITAAPRKRGRPKTVRTGEEQAFSTSSPPHISKTAKLSKRQPHNQVERKYREGLNAELERLRMALPTTHKWEVASTCGASGPKASKAAVLAGAVAYIQDMEQERDHLKRENELLKSERSFARKGRYEE